MSSKQWEYEPSDKDLKNLREWLRQRPHLVQDYNDEFLAAFFRGCKGNLHKTKTILENFNRFGLRYPYLFGDLDPFYEKLQEHLSVARIFPLPKRLKDGSLVSIAVVDSDKTDSYKFHSLESIRYCLLWFYILLWENNYGNGKAVAILDQKNLTMFHYKDMTPVVIRDAAEALKSSLPVRPQAVHFINVTPSMASFLNLLKCLIPKKYSNKMYFHSDMETLYEKIPKEILPEEYEGNEGNILTLFNQWKNKVESYKDRLVEENSKMRNWTGFERNRIKPLKYSRN